MTELCIRCGRPTPYHPNTPITLRSYYIEGSGQLCEQCFSRLYSTTPEPSFTPTQANNQTSENIKTLTLPAAITPTRTDQTLYEFIINKPQLTDEDREILSSLFQKYTI